MQGTPTGRPVGRGDGRTSVQHRNGWEEEAEGGKLRRGGQKEWGQELSPSLEVDEATVISIVHVAPTCVAAVRFLHVSIEEPHEDEYGFTGSTEEQDAAAMIQSQWRSRQPVGMCSSGYTSALQCIRPIWASGSLVR